MKQSEWELVRRVRRSASAKVPKGRRVIWRPKPNRYTEVLRSWIQANAVFHLATFCCKFEQRKQRRRLTERNLSQFWLRGNLFKRSLSRSPHSGAENEQPIGGISAPGGLTTASARSAKHPVLLCGETRSLLYIANTKSSFRFPPFVAFPPFEGLNFKCPNMNKLIALSEIPRELWEFNHSHHHFPNAP